jgi:hypothetical protein
MELKGATYGRSIHGGSLSQHRPTVINEITISISSYNIERLSEQAYRMTPGSFFKLSFNVASTGGEVSKSMLKWLIVTSKKFEVSEMSGEKSCKLSKPDDRIVA